MFRQIANAIMGNEPTGATPRTTRTLAAIRNDLIILRDELTELRDMESRTVMAIEERIDLLRIEKSNAITRAAEAGQLACGLDEAVERV